MAFLQANPTVNRRMAFATNYLPSDIPCYWDIVAGFANQVASGKSTVTPESAKVAMENMQVLYKDAFTSDADLTHQLIAMEYSVTKQPLGVLLVPCEKNAFCVMENFYYGQIALVGSLYTQGPLVLSPPLTSTSSATTTAKAAVLSNFMDSTNQAPDACTTMRTG